MTEQKEISFREFFQGIKNFIKYLWSKWLVFLVIGIIGACLGLWYAWRYKPKYTASLSFILSNSAEGSSPLMGLASQLGFNVNGNNDNTFSSDNIISLMTSRIIMEKALFRSVPETGKSLINLFCEDLRLNESWNKLERTKGAYPFPADPSKMNNVQDSLVRYVYETVTNNYIEVSRPDKIQSIFVVKTTSEDELFSQYLTKSLVDVTTKFYIETKTKTAKDNLDMLQHEADSLRSLLSGSISSTAQIYDYTYNLNPALQSQRAPAQEGQMKVEVLGTAYGEVVKNLELAKITLQQQTPLYQIIDEPRLPLVAEKPGKLFSLIVGGLLAGFVLILFFLVKKVYRAFS